MGSSGDAMIPDRRTTCGLLCWRPDWLQALASPKLYLALYAFIGVLQGMTFSYLSVVLSTIEKRFGLQSKEAAWIYSGNEISQIFFIVFLPFVGRVKRRPLFISMGIILSAIGSIIIAVPNFSGDQSYLIERAESSHSGPNGKNVGDACFVNETRVDHCVNKHGGVKDYASLAVVFVGIFIIGIGVSMYYSFGVPFVDDNSKKKNSPLMLSFVMASRVLGPSLGYALGSACLAVYVDPAHPPDFNEDDPRWIGGWWMGFLVVGACLLAAAPWLMLFPQRLNGTNADAKVAASSAKAGDPDPDPETPTQWLQELTGVTTRLFSNRLWVLNLTSSIFVLFGVIGFAQFVPKYIEYHFRQRASTSGGLGGLAKTISSVVGIIGSGYLIYRFRFRAKTLAGLCAIGSVFSFLSFIVLLLMRCPRVELYGLGMPVAGDGSNNNNASLFTSSCNRDCQCDSVSFHPVCSVDGVTNFFSPCHAGCKLVNETMADVKANKTKKLFWDCSCVEQVSRQTHLPAAETWWLPKTDSEAKSPLAAATLKDQLLSAAVDGYCPFDCSGVFYALLGILFCTGLVSASTRVPNLLINLRIVAPADKSASMTVTVSMLSLCAFLPSPFVYGALIDSTCVLWGTKCGERTNCLVYDTDAMRHYMGGMSAASVFIAVLCDTLVWHVIPDLPIYDDEPQAKGDTNDNVKTEELSLESASFDQQKEEGEHRKKQ